MQSFCCETVTTAPPVLQFRGSEIGGEVECEGDGEVTEIDVGTRN